jgi:hypothetical protein
MIQKLEGISSILRDFCGYTEAEMDTAVRELAECLVGEYQLYQPTIWRDGLDYFVADMPEDLDPETGRPIGISKIGCCVWGA